MTSQEGAQPPDTSLGRGTIVTPSGAQGTAARCLGGRRKRRRRARSEAGGARIYTVYTVPRFIQSQSVRSRTAAHARKGCQPSTAKPEPSLAWPLSHHELSSRLECLLFFSFCDGGSASTTPHRGPRRKERAAKPYGTVPRCCAHLPHLVLFPAPLGAAAAAAGRVAVVAAAAVAARVAIAPPRPLMLMLVLLLLFFVLLLLLLLVLENRHATSARMMVRLHAMLCRVTRLCFSFFAFLALPPSAAPPAAPTLAASAAVASMRRSHCARRCPASEQLGATACAGRRVGVAPRQLGPSCSRWRCAFRPRTRNTSGKARQGWLALRR